MRKRLAGLLTDSATYGAGTALGHLVGFLLLPVYTSYLSPVDYVQSTHLKNDHRPLSLETSIPGVFAIGDARASSTKRVAAAVGEGAAVVAQVHAWLASHETVPAQATEHDGLSRRVN